MSWSRAWTQVVSALPTAPSSLQPCGAIVQSHIFFLEGKICHLQLEIFLRILNAQTVGWLRSDCGRWKVKMGFRDRATSHQPRKFLCWCTFSSLRAPPFHISNPWHSPPCRLTGFSGCSEWVFYFSSSTVETKVTLKWNFQKIATYLLSLWGGEFHSVWIIGAFTCQCNSVSALLMI